MVKRELLAVHNALQKFKYYLIGRKFLVRVDHQALSWLQRSKALSGQLERWATAMGDYEFDIEYRPGRKHANADALSRRDELVEKPVALTPEDKKWFQTLRVKIPTKTKKAAQLEVAKDGTQKAAELLAALTRQRRREQEGRVKVQHPEPQELIRDVRGDPKAVPTQDAEPPTPPGAETPQEPMAERNETRAEENLQGEPEACKCAKAPAELVLAGRDYTDGFEWENLPKEQFETPERAVEQYDMVKEQKRDPDLQMVRKWVQEQRRPKAREVTNPTLRAYAAKQPDIKLVDNRLVLQEGGRQRLCIPTALIGDIIRCLHQHPLAGHIGRRRCYIAARQNFYWPGLGRHIDTAIGGCTPCAKAKRRKPVPQVPLGQTSTAVLGRFEVFYFDLVGPFPKASQDAGAYQYLVTAQDAVTKYSEAWPIKDPTAETVVRILVDHMLPRYGSGFKIVTDRGRQFTSALFASATKKLGVITHLNQAYEPKSNAVERLHRTLEEAMRALMEAENADPSQWPRYVGCALASMRQSPLSNLPASPHYLVYAVEPVLPAQVLTGHRPVPRPTLEIDRDIQRLEKVLDQVRRRQLENHERNKATYDARLKQKPVEAGEYCHLYAPRDTTASGQSKKTSVHLHGPYRVTRILNDRQAEIAVGLETGPQGDTKPVHKIVSRDRLVRSTQYDYFRIPAPLAWPIARKYKTKLLPRAAEASARPTGRREARMVGGVPVPFLSGAGPPPPPAPLPQGAAPGPPLPEGDNEAEPAAEAPPNEEQQPPPEEQADAEPADEAMREAGEDNGEWRGENPMGEPHPSEHEGMDEARALDYREYPLPMDDGEWSDSRKRARPESSSSEGFEGDRESPMEKRERQDPTSSENDIRAPDPEPSPPLPPEDEPNILDDLGRALNALPAGGEPKEEKQGTQLPKPRTFLQPTRPAPVDPTKFELTTYLDYVKLDPAAVEPKRRTPGSVGFDIAPLEKPRLEKGEIAKIRTGLILKAPPGTYIRIAERSSLAAAGIEVRGGVIDPDFNGETQVIVCNNTGRILDLRSVRYIAQAIVEKVLLPKPREIRKESLPETTRGTRGFGSTDTLKPEPVPRKKTK